MFTITNEHKEHWLSFIEIDITEQCNLSCNACSRCCDKFKSNKHIDIKIVRQFVKESIVLNYKWKSIKILGGEPTLHPELDKIIKILYEYKLFNVDCLISILSNGVIKRNYPDWFIDEYTLDHSFHRPFYISPMDEGKFGINKLCCTLWQCGIGLGSYGYTPCALGTAMCRIWGFRGVTSLYNCTGENLLNQCKNICKHCGAYLVDSHDFSKGDIFNYEVMQMTPSWVNRLEEYNKNKNIF